MQQKVTIKTKHAFWEEEIVYPVLQLIFVPIMCHVSRHCTTLDVLCPVCEQQLCTSAITMYWRAASMTWGQRRHNKEEPLQVESVFQERSFQVIRIQASSEHHLLQSQRQRRLLYEVQKVSSVEDSQSDCAATTNITCNHLVALRVWCCSLISIYCSMDLLCSHISHGSGQIEEFSHNILTFMRKERY